MAYDIQQLTDAPRHVVLSACDVGRAVVRPGEEILGFTAALLYIGTATVTSSVTPVADDAAVGMMTAYHRLLAAGIRPAEALAGATAAEPFQICRTSGLKPGRKRLRNTGGRSAAARPVLADQVTAQTEASRLAQPAGASSTAQARARIAAANRSGAPVAS